ncbi:hypothetical protein B0H14DRAFT_3021537 [Mycena olivaceomarginata]|nr:hypothetical protein B0H14DRAFT_3021537 [Mycena olivaceomarginata]
MQMYSRPVDEAAAAFLAAYYSDPATAEHLYFCRCACYQQTHHACTTREPMMRRIVSIPHVRKIMRRGDLRTDGDYVSLHERPVDASLLEPEGRSLHIRASTDASTLLVILSAVPHSPRSIRVYTSPLRSFSVPPHPTLPSRTHRRHPPSSDVSHPFSLSRSSCPQTRRPSIHTYFPALWGSRTGGARGEDGFFLCSSSPVGLCTSTSTTTVVVRCRKAQPCTCVKSISRRAGLMYVRGGYDVKRRRVGCAAVESARLAHTSRHLHAVHSGQLRPH